MPKILRIVNRFNLGGPTYNVAYLTRYLAPEFETLLIGGCREESEADSDFIVRNLGLEPVILQTMKRSLNPLNDLKTYLEIRRIIRDFRPDIVHTHASKAGALGRMAAVSLHVPVIVHTFHGHVFDGYFSRTKSYIFRKIEQFLAKRTTAIIALSEKQKDDLAYKYRICKASKIEIIPLGFDLSRFRENMPAKRAAFRQKYGLADDEIATGIIGRLVPIKNHALFLKAVRFVNIHSGRKVRAFIIGDGEDRAKLEREAARLEIPFTDVPEQSSGKLLIFTSWIRDIDTAIAGLDIVALTSLNEGTPVSIIEAQAGNKPVVATDAGGIRNVVIAGKTALLSEVGNEKDFEKNLLRLVRDDGLRHNLSLGGWDFVENKFHYTRLVKDTGEFYTKLLNFRF